MSIRSTTELGVRRWLADKWPSLVAWACILLVVYFFGIATHLVNTGASDSDALLEFIGSIIGAAIGPGLAVMGSFWLERLNRAESLRHDRQLLAAALEQLARAITNPPSTRLTDVSGPMSARREREQARAIREAMVDSQEFMLLAKNGLRIGDLSLLRGLSELQRRMEVAMRVLRQAEDESAEADSEQAVGLLLARATKHAADDLLPTIYAAREQLGH